VSAVAGTADPGDGPQIVEGVDIDRLAAAINSCPSVARLGGGRPGALATYLPGRRVSGVRVAVDSIEVEVVARWNVAIGDVALEVRRAAGSLAPNRRVDVTIVDVEPALGSAI
jgi:hypothetical protein